MSTRSDLRRAGLTAILAVPAIAMAQETITFPSRASNLADGSYWTVGEFGEGCCTIDFNTRRWNGTEWRKGSGTSTNAQDYDWNTPLYAPANGVVASCWRNFPDDPSPGVNPPNNGNIFGGGNHLVILTDQGNAISLNHFKAGTIPPELCPNNAGSAQFPATQDKEDYWRVAAYVASNRPRVLEGTFIGRAGSSGNSSAPHLHMSMHVVTGTDLQGREAIGPSVPMRFRHAWGHRFEADEQTTSGGWYRLRGGEFAGDPACPGYQADSPGCGFKMVHASPYLRRASASAGAVSDVATVFLSANRAVTAVIDDGGKLKLVSWDFVGTDSIVRKHDLGTGWAIKDVQIVEAASDHVLVAVRDQSDNLQMLAYAVTPTGSFVPVAHRGAGKISALAMTTTPDVDRKAVTAVRDQAGNLKLIVWDLLFANGGVSIDRRGEASAGAVSALSISPARAFGGGVFTAVRDSAGNLKVIPWRVTGGGNTVTRGADASAGSVGTQLAVAPLKQGVAAAVRDSDGNLRVITWSVSSSGDIGARRSTLTAGGISEIGMLTTPLAESNLTTVVRDASGNLLLVGWAINDNGENLRRIGSSVAGAATKISVAGVMRTYPGKDPRDMIVTALRDSQGDLKLVSWDTNLVDP